MRTRSQIQRMLPVQVNQRAEKVIMQSPRSFITNDRTQNIQNRDTSSKSITMAGGQGFTSVRSTQILKPTGYYNPVPAAPRHVEQITLNLTQELPAQTDARMVYRDASQTQHEPSRNGSHKVSVSELMSEIESWRIRYMNLENEYHQRETKEEELQQYKKLLHQQKTVYENEVDHFRQENNRLRILVAQQSSESSQMMEEFSSLQNRNEQLQVEMDKLGLIKQGEIKQYQKQIQEFLSIEQQIRMRDEIIEERSQEISRLRQQALCLQQLELVIQDLKVEKVDLNKAIDQVIEEKTQSIQHAQQMNEKNQILLDQLDKLQISFDNLDQDNQELQRDSEQQQQEINELENENNKINQSNSQLYQSNSQLQQSNSFLNINLDSRSDQIKILESELKLLKSNLNEQSSNVEDLFNQIQLCSLKVAQLTSALDESNTHVALQKNFNEDLQQKHQQLTQQHQQLTQQHQQVTQQHQQVTQQHLQVTQQCQQVTQQYQQLTQQHQMLTQQHQQVTQQYQQLTSQHQQLIYDSESTETDLQSRIRTLDSTIRKSQLDLQENSNRLQTLQQNNQSINDQLEEERQLSREEALQSQNQMEEVLRQHQILSGSQQQELEESLQALQTIVDENNLLQGRCQRYEEIQMDWQEQSEQQKNEVNSWKDKFVKLNREFHNNQEALMMLQAEHDAAKQRKAATLIGVKENMNYSQRESLTSMPMNLLKRTSTKN